MTRKILHACLNDLGDHYNVHSNYTSWRDAVASAGLYTSVMPARLMVTERAAPEERASKFVLFVILNNDMRLITANAGSFEEAEVQARRYGGVPARMLIMSPDYAE
jgi:hypothetical protein